jgi:hypothetical protein
MEIQIVFQLGCQPLRGPIELHLNPNELLTGRFSLP